MLSLLTGSVWRPSKASDDERTNPAEFHLSRNFMRSTIYAGQCANRATTLRAMHELAFLLTCAGATVYVDEA